LEKIGKMISQGKLFPFGELKEKHIEVYPEINAAIASKDVGVGGSYGKWEKEKGKGKGGGGDKSYISETGNLGVIYDYVEDMDTQVEDAVAGVEVESFKEGGYRIDGDDVRVAGDKVGEMGREGKKSVRFADHPRHKEREEEEHSEWRGHSRGYVREHRGYEVPFWTEDPNVLFYPTYVYEIFPVESMSHHQKLNSITRMIILLTLVGFLFVRNLRILWIGAVCLLAIFLLQYTQKKRVVVGDMGVGGVVEGFDGALEDLGVDAPAQAVINAFSTDDPSKIGKRVFFDTPKVNNPYNNVLVTDIVDNPNKLPALPAYYAETEKEILDKTKEAIQKMNPTFPNMTEKLFASLDDHFEFEQSARQFYSNPSTTIPNDQGAFAEFCYGEMISCKEGNMFACARDAPRHNLY
jgi:hypothetical protein